jgi:hypothetical protein
MSLRRRALLVITALLAALLSPLLIAAPAEASEVSGTEVFYGTTSFGAWADTTISDDFTVGVPYSSTVQLPDVRPMTFVDLTDSVIPDGLTLDYNNSAPYPNNPVVTLYGTPTTPAASTTIVLQFNAYAGGYTQLVFTGIEIKRVPTTTTVGDDDYRQYTGVNLSASVSAGTGTVEFFLDGTSVATSPVSSGTASYTGPVPASFVGTSPVVTAVYSGDATYAPSTSTSDPILYVYGDRIIRGTVVKNGVPQAGVPVRLLTSTYATAGPVDTTDVNGEFQLDVGEPPSFIAAQAGYAIEAPSLGIYYSTSWVLGGANVSYIGDATVVYEANWNSGLTIYNNVPPTWSDDTLAQPRLGSAYSDSVVATTVGTPSTITYSVTGDVPSWLSFSAGTFTATNPTDQDPHTFTVQATSAYRYTTKTFTLTAANAWIAPSFTDGDVATAQAGVYLDDEVFATGDGPIVYSVTGGALPSWLTLDASSGAITGTPPLSAAGQFYWYTVTATGHGVANVLIAAVVAPAPSVALDIGFAVGDLAAGSTFDFDITGAGDSVPYSVTVNSAPFVAASGLTSALGAATGTGAIQSAIDAGAHSIVLTTTASDGTVRTVTVWFTVLRDGTIGAISLLGPIAFIDLAALASTGSAVTPPLAMALAVGLLGIFLYRRRATRSEQA